MRTMRRGLGVAVLAVLAVSTFGIGHAGAIPTVHSFGPADLWVGLKNSDDQGTSFDIKLELFNGGSTPVGTIIARCVNGVTRNPSLATEVTGFNNVSVSGNGGSYSVKISARIGTNAADDTKCGTGHNNATGLRLYYDGGTRASNFTYGFGWDSYRAYLHSNGNPCQNAPSTGVTNRFFNNVAPGSSAPAKCKDSGGVNFAGGNPWSEIGTWTGFLSGGA